MNTRTGRLALAAAVILIVLGGIDLLAFGQRTPAANGGLARAAAWGQEILHSLEKIEAVVYRQRVGCVSDFGLPEMSRG